MVENCVKLHPFGSERDKNHCEQCQFIILDPIIHSASFEACGAIVNNIIINNAFYNYYYIICSKWSELVRFMRNA